MNPRLDPKLETQWLRKLDRATAAYERARRTLDELVADARATGVPLTTIAKHTPYSREWARQIADRIDTERTKRATAEDEPPPATPTPTPHPSPAAE